LYIKIIESPRNIGFLQKANFFETPPSNEKNSGKIVGLYTKKVRFFSVVNLIFINSILSDTERTSRVVENCSLFQPHFAILLSGR